MIYYYWTVSARIKVRTLKQKESSLLNKKYAEKILIGQYLGDVSSDDPAITIDEILTQWMANRLLTSYVFRYEICTVTIHQIKREKSKYFVKGYAALIALHIPNDKIPDPIFVDERVTCYSYSTN